MNLRKVLMLDLSPLRPWEYAQTDAGEWIEMVTLRNTYQDAIAEIDGEAAQFARTG